MPLIAVEGDQNSHGGGALIAGGASSPGTVRIGGSKVIVHESPAEVDTIHGPPATYTAGGSSKVFIYGAPVHRHGDFRVCGSTTIATGQSSVEAG